VELAPACVTRLGGRNGVAVAIDVLGLDEEPPFCKGAVDSTGQASISFSSTYPTTRPPYIGALTKALASKEDEDSEIQFVAFNLDGAYPIGEPHDELGMASLSLKQLMRRERDHELGPLPIIGSNAERVGTITCAVRAVAALRAAGLATPASVAAPSPEAISSAPPGTKPYVFQAGPLGLTLVDAAGAVVIAQVDIGSQAHSLQVPQGGRIVSLNGELIDASVKRSKLVEMIKALPRPVALGIQSQPFAQELLQLMGMGFDRAKAQAALQSCGGNVQDAAELLLSQST